MLTSFFIELNCYILAISVRYFAHMLITSWINLLGFHVARDRAYKDKMLWVRYWGMWSVTRPPRQDRRHFWQYFNFRVDQLTVMNKTPPTRRELLLGCQIRSTSQERSPASRLARLSFAKPIGKHYAIIGLVLSTVALVIRLNRDQLQKMLWISSNVYLFDTRKIFLTLWNEN